MEIRKFKGSFKHGADPLVMDYCDTFLCVTNDNGRQVFFNLIGPLFEHIDHILNNYKPYSVNRCYIMNELETEVIEPVDSNEFGIGVYININLPPYINEWYFGGYEETFSSFVKNGNDKIRGTIISYAPDCVNANNYREYGEQKSPYSWTELSLGKSSLGICTVAFVVNEVSYIYNFLTSELSLNTDYVLNKKLLNMSI